MYQIRGTLKTISNKCIIFQTDFVPREIFMTKSCMRIGGHNSIRILNNDLAQILSNEMHEDAIRNGYDSWINMEFIFHVDIAHIYNSYNKFRVRKKIPLLILRNMSYV